MKKTLPLLVFFLFAFFFSFSQVDNNNNNSVTENNSNNISLSADEEMNIIEGFYTAFNKLDAEKMVACYHDDVIFHDPAFGELKGDRAKAMWRMLCSSAEDFSLEFSNVTLNDSTGSAHWEADYIFPTTGKNVHNIVDATFELKDGKIIKHTDVFNTRKWASQAMGWKGKLLGGTRFFKKKLQQQTNKMLDEFIAENGL